MDFILLREGAARVFSPGKSSFCHEVLYELFVQQSSLTEMVLSTKCGKVNLFVYELDYTLLWHGGAGTAGRTGDKGGGSADAACCGGGARGLGR